LKKELSDDLQAVSSWLVDNKLSLHLGKTESVVFGSKHKLKSNPSLNVSCNGIVIQSTSSFKYFGATLDQNLSCENIASSVINKANARLKVLYRKRHFLTEHTKKILSIPTVLGSVKRGVIISLRLVHLVLKPLPMLGAFYRTVCQLILKTSFKTGVKNHFCNI